MVLVYKGRGWLVGVTAVAAGIVCAMADLRDPRVFWSVVAASGLVDHYLGRKWNTLEPRLFQDLTTGEVHEVKEVHSFFWIPMQYWLYVKVLLCGLAIASAVAHRPG